MSDDGNDALLFIYRLYRARSVADAAQFTLQSTKGTTSRQIPVCGTDYFVQIGAIILSQDAGCHLEPVVNIINACEWYYTCMT